MIIIILWAASGLAGLATGLASFRVLAIILASPIVASFSAALLHYHGFGLASGVVILVATMTVLQGFYLVGVSIKYLTADDQ